MLEEVQEAEGEEPVRERRETGALRGGLAEEVRGGRLAHVGDERGAEPALVAGIGTDEGHRRYDEKGERETVREGGAAPPVRRGDARPGEDERARGEHGDDHDEAVALRDAGEQRGDADPDEVATAPSREEAHAVVDGQRAEQDHEGIVGRLRAHADEPGIERGERDHRDPRAVRDRALAKEPDDDQQGQHAGRTAHQLRGAHERRAGGAAAHRAPHEGGGQVIELGLERLPFLVPRRETMLEGDDPDHGEVPVVRLFVDKGQPEPRHDPQHQHRREERLPDVPAGPTGGVHGTKGPPPGMGAVTAGCRGRRPGYRLQTWLRRPTAGTPNPSRPGSG
jgi:hypothetical protein